MFATEIRRFGIIFFLDFLFLFFFFLSHHYHYQRRSAYGGIRGITEGRRDPSSFRLVWTIVSYSTEFSPVRESSVRLSVGIQRKRNPNPFIELYSVGEHFAEAGEEPLELKLLAVG